MIGVTIYLNVVDDLHVVKTTGHQTYGCGNKPTYDACDTHFEIGECITRHSNTVTCNTIDASGWSVATRRTYLAHIGCEDLLPFNTLDEWLNDHVHADFAQAFRTAFVRDECDNHEVYNLDVEQGCGIEITRDLLAIERAWRSLHVSRRVPVNSPICGALIDAAVASANIHYFG